VIAAAGAAGSARDARALELRGLTKRFGRITAVDRLSLKVERGVAAGLLGVNGAGKTTTIAMILGLLLPTAGRAIVFGEDVASHRHRVLARMNFCSPYADLPRRLTGRQNLRVYTDLYDVPDPCARIAELAADLRLTAVLDRPTGKLSAGERTRLVLAKSLLNRPGLLLLDEPTASLDPDSADVIRSYLEAYRRREGATLLLASHNMAEVTRLCDEVFIIKQGRLVDQGSPAALVARYGRADLEEVFLHLSRGPALSTAAE
jgi:ABC-2 type transport system ATP-binding protein